MTEKRVLSLLAFPLFLQIRKTNRVSGPAHECMTLFMQIEPKACDSAISEVVIAAPGWRARGNNYARISRFSGITG